MLFPTTVPGVVDQRVGQALHPRWTRARGALSLALVGCPWLVVALCLAAAVTAGVLGDHGGWAFLPVVGAVVPAAVVLARVGALTYEPPRWVMAAVVTGGVQLMLGVVPVVGMAAGAGGAGAAVATAVAAPALSAVIVAAGSASRAMRALFTPLSWELGATPFTLALRARLHDTGLLSGSVSLHRHGIGCAARRHRATGEYFVPFAEVRDAVPTTLPAEQGAQPWLWLSDGSATRFTPGPAVLVRTGSATVTLPVDDPALFVALLHARMAAWRHGADRTS